MLFHHMHTHALTLIRVHAHLEKTQKNTYTEALGRVILRKKVKADVFPKNDGLRKVKSIMC